MYTGRENRSNNALQDTRTHYRPVASYKVRKQGCKHCVEEGIK